MAERRNYRIAVGDRVRVRSNAAGVPVYAEVTNINWNTGIVRVRVFQNTLRGGRGRFLEGEEEVSLQQLAAENNAIAVQGGPGPSAPQAPGPAVPPAPQAPGPAVPPARNRAPRSPPAALNLAMCRTPPQRRPAPDLNLAMCETPPVDLNAAMCETPEPFKCPYCNTYFLTQRRLREHVEENHRHDMTTLPIGTPSPPPPPPSQPQRK